MRKPSSSPKPIDYLYHSPEDIRKAGLLSPERIAELDALLISCVSDILNSRGGVVASHKSVRLAKGEWMYRTDDAYAIEHMHKDIWKEHMTQDELRLIAEHCSSASHQRADEARFAKATKMSEAEYAKLDTHSGCFHGDEYHSDISEVYDWVEEAEDNEVPAYVWAARRTVIVPSLDVAEILESWIDQNGYEDLDIESVFNGLPELEAALETFVRANTGTVSYQEDTSIAVILDKTSPPSPLSS